MTQRCANNIPTKVLIEIIYTFCQAYSGVHFFPYQEQFARRIIRSVLDNDGAELTALFARQCIAKGSVIHTRDGKLVKIEDHPDSWITQQSADTIIIRGKGGYNVRCTKNHPIFTKEMGWVPAGILKVGDKISVLDEWDNFGEDTRNQVVQKLNFEYSKYGSICRTDGELKILLNCANSSYFAEVCRENLNKLGMHGAIENESGTYYLILSGKANITKFKCIFGTDLFGISPFCLDLNGIPSEDEIEYEKYIGEDKEVLKWVSVCSIKDAKDKIDVYDVAYPGKEWFICGGIKVHNSGKSETVATVVGGLLIILPVLANQPRFAGDVRLEDFRDGFFVGIFAPSQRQASLTYGRMKDRIQSPNALEILSSPEFNMTFSTSNGQTVALSNGSFATAISASDNTNIEGESFKLLIIEECQDVSNFKIRKCLSGDTKIMLADGSYKTISSVVRDKKDKVALIDDQFNLTECFPTEFYDNGIQPVYEVTLVNGKTVKATLNHQFLTYSKNTKKAGAKYRMVSEILESFSKYSALRIALPESIPLFTKNDMPKDYFRGLILGYFLGDGCFVGTPKFSKDSETVARLHEAIKEVIDPDISLTIVNQKEDFLSVCFSTPTNKKNSNSLKQWFNLMGYAHEPTGENKYLENFEQSREFYLGFVTGLIETDGCICCKKNKAEISFSNISSKLVFQLQDILHKFGVHGVVSSRRNDHPGSFGGLNNKLLWEYKIKSVRDLNNFALNFRLYNKQTNLDEILLVIQRKSSRVISDRYSESLRFCRVKSIKYVGEEPTYCLKTKYRNFIANGMISSNSISPMGAAYNATIVKIGTATTFVGDFYEAIQRNIADFAAKLIKVKNHFEYDWKVAAKYNPRYAKYIEKEKRRLGEDSDEFNMSYNLRWILARGMFFNMTKFESVNARFDLERVYSDNVKLHVVGIDLAKKSDSTVVTVVEVDWNAPVTVETLEKGEDSFKAYKTIVKDWLEIQGDDYEDQYYQILTYLSNFNVRRIYVDATAQESFSDRLRANLNCEVFPYMFTPRGKSDMYKYLDGEIKAGRFQFPAGDETRKTREYQNFIKQCSDLQKGWRGQIMVVSHPETRGAHDDYPDSVALAVMASKEEISLMQAESKKNPFTQPNVQAKNYYDKRNSITAKRR